MKYLEIAWLGVVSLLTIATFGCHGTASGEVRPTLPAAPYEVADGGQLHVREDIMRALAFAPATRSDVQAKLEGYGHVALATGASYAVRIATAAFVEHVDVAVGDTVVVGTPLATLLSPEIARLRSETSRLRAQLQAERDSVVRVERLIAQNAASMRELVEARSHVGALQAELQGILGQLSASGAEVGSGARFVLRAHAAGPVLTRTIDPGARVTSESEAAFLIGDTSAVVVRASFPERDAPLLQEGVPCVFTVQSLGGDRLEGTVAQIVRTIDSNTRAATVLCRPKTPDPRMRAQMVARVEINVRGTGLLSIPRSALLLRRDDRVVFVRSADGTLERRVVETGAVLGEAVQIMKGLRESEQVVTENAVLLDGELDAVL